MRNRAFFFIIPIVLLIAIGGAGAWWMNSSAGIESEEDLAANDVATPYENNLEAASGEVATPIPAENMTPIGTPGPHDIKVVVEGNDPKAPRSIGSIDAPVTLIEYSSLTCPHCADAHARILPRLIKDYVDTGKLRIVFSDFPLNAQALDASKVSRCIANDQYFNFLTLLFSSIEQWAYSNNHPNALLTNATLAGLPRERAEECLNDKDLETALLGSSQEAMQKYQIASTPTFVLNDGAKIIAGAKPYSDFTTAIEALLAQKQQ